MHISMTSEAQFGLESFALASTYIESRNLTLSILFGCSSERITRVHNLLLGAESAIKHPYLMLGVSAELQLARLQDLVWDKARKCLETTRMLEATMQDQSATQNASSPESEITWDLIDRVCRNRDELQRAEEEVKATKRQLSKALPPALRSSID